MNIRRCGPLKPAFTENSAGLGYGDHSITVGGSLDRPTIQYNIRF